MLLTPYHTLHVGPAFRAVGHTWSFVCFTHTHRRAHTGTFSGCIQIYCRCLASSSPWLHPPNPHGQINKNGVAAHFTYTDTETHTHTVKYSRERQRGEKKYWQMKNCFECINNFRWYIQISSQCYCNCFYLFFLSIFFIFGAELSTAWCVSAALPKDHPSIKQYGVGTVWYCYGSLLRFPVDQVLGLYFFLCYCVLATDAANCHCCTTLASLFTPHKLGTHQILLTHWTGIFLGFCEKERANKWHLGYVK